MKSKAVAALAGLCVFTISLPSSAEEGGAGHYAPGADATMIDLVPTQPGWALEPIFVHYTTYVLHNTSEPANHWIKVELSSRNENNPRAVGAKFWTYEGNRLGEPEGLIAYTQYASFTGSSPEIHLGVGSHDRVDLRVRFPGGRQVELTDAAVDRKIEIVEPPG